MQVTYEKAKGSGSGEGSKWVTYYITDRDVVKWFLWYRQKTWSLHNGKGRVFLQWRNGEPHNQPYGYRFFSSKCYKDIARLLGKKNYDKFSGHSMCRTAASIFSANGMFFISGIYRNFFGKKSVFYPFFSGYFMK